MIGCLFIRDPDQPGIYTSQIVVRPPRNVQTHQLPKSCALAVLLVVYIKLLTVVYSSTQLAYSAKHFSVVSEYVIQSIALNHGGARKIVGMPAPAWPSVPRYDYAVMWSCVMCVLCDMCDDCFRALHLVAKLSRELLFHSPNRLHCEYVYVTVIPPQNASDINIPFGQTQTLSV